MVLTVHIFIVPLCSTVIALHLWILVYWHQNNIGLFSFPLQKSAILTTVGVLEQPLGNARLHVARLVAALLQTNALSICQELCNLSTMDLLLVG